MAEEHKNEESLPNLDPAVEVVERESLMEKLSVKIHHKGRDPCIRFSAAENINFLTVITKKVMQTDQLLDAICRCLVSS